MTAKDETTWRDNLEKFKTQTKQINNKIDKYNLLVPILQKQMLHISLEEFAKEALVSPLKNTKKYADVSHKSNKNLNETISQDLFNFILNIFSRKIR